MITTILLTATSIIIFLLIRIYEISKDVKFYHTELNDLDHKSEIKINELWDIIKRKKHKLWYARRRINELEYKLLKLDWNRRHRSWRKFND